VYGRRAINSILVTGIAFYCRTKPVVLLKGSSLGVTKLLTTRTEKNVMKIKPVVVSAVLLTTLVGGTAIQAAEQKDYELFANINLASNYIWRGVTQTSDQSAIQGGIDYQRKNGIYECGQWL